MSKILIGLLIGVLTATFTLDAEAQRRLGGGRNIGKQAPQVQPKQAAPAQQSAATLAQSFGSALTAPCG